MNKDVSASGERAAIGGYLPQFDEFASLVYQNLVNEQLDWLKIADPHAEKLDDIQYATYSEVHAYQVKWTIADAKISYNDFCKLLPFLTSSWKTLQVINKHKIVIPHLITNKELTSNDKIKNDKKNLGSFSDFIEEVWDKIKTNQPIDKKWNSTLKDFERLTNLSKNELLDFIKYFDFQFDYKQKKIRVGNIRHSKEDEDLLQISRFLFEEVGSNKRNVKFTRVDIINELGWDNRFKTIFPHDLIIDRQTYQPIKETQELINRKLDESENGYLFLIGGPGTGKSSLLTNWSKNRKERIIKYYAFDFQTPSSQFNFFERGETTTLFFDLVYQLKDSGIYDNEILPYKDITFLKNTFFEQLKAASNLFLKDGRKTILIIDGLDHLPREYHSAKQNFLSELLSPKEIPIGVYIILGSQTYDLENINIEVKREFDKGERTIKISSLSKKEVFKYLYNRNKTLTNHQKTKIFEKTQGHPLYLTYLVERINNKTNIDSLINSFIKIEGTIEEYYSKIWKPIQKEDELIELLGLICRINGLVNISFVKEWNYNQSVLRSFNDKAKFLFNRSDNKWTFFHNSFKQFLLKNTSIDILTSEYDEKINLDYYSKLANYYNITNVDFKWKQNFHLFKAEQFDEFLKVATPESFTFQFVNYRPINEIKQDIKLGVEIARRKENVQILVRYYFALVEIEKRLFNIDPASFTEELLMLNKCEEAKNYLRINNTLNCSPRYALKASRLFNYYGDETESSILFNLAFPDEISETGIEIEDNHKFDEVKETIEEWIYTAPYFMEVDKIIQTISNVNIVESEGHHFQNNKNVDLHIDLLTHLAYSLSEIEKWEELDKLIKRFDLQNIEHCNSLYFILKNAINKCIDSYDKKNSKKYLSILIKSFSKQTTLTNRRIIIADLIFEVYEDIELAYTWIKGITQPHIADKSSLDYNDSLNKFRPLIKLNKILNISGNGVSITKAIPSAKKGTDEEILVEFERMLCLITQILSDGILNKPIYTKISILVYPIVNFYYKEVSHHNIYWFKLSKSRGSYFEFLIYSISRNGNESLQILGDYLSDEFDKNSEYWSPTTRRKIIRALIIYGYDIIKAKVQLHKIEPKMLDGHDISSRIDECLAHANVWFLIGDKELAEKWVKQTIQESIGVGYSKDYQFNTWVDWLNKVNLEEPKEAVSRINWFLSHLSHIKKTTEGKSYWNASEGILKTAFNYNLSAGFTQLKWQLDNSLIDFDASLSIFIENYIEHVKTELEYKDIVNLFTELLLYISKLSYEDLLDKILEKGFSILDLAFYDKYISNIIFIIRTNVLEQNRNSLLQIIEEFCVKKDINILDYCSDYNKIEEEKEDDSRRANILILKNKEEIKEDKVLEIVNSYENFKDLINKENVEVSKFYWSRTLEKMIPLMSEIQIEEILKIIKTGGRDSFFYSKLSKSVFDKGNKELALYLANKSLELSKSSGWAKYSDGGTRIDAFKALKVIDSKVASKKALHVFTHDIINNDYPDSFVTYLDEILPLLTEDMNIESIWDEIYKYLKRLMSNSSPIKEIPIHVVSNKPVNNTFIDYLIYLLNTPTTIIQEKSILLLSKCIDNGNEYALNKITSKNRIDSSAINDIMMLLLEFKSNKLKEFKSIALEFSISKNYLIRKNAGLVLVELREEIPKPKKISPPHIFSLQLPHQETIEHKKETNIFNPTIDINNPYELVAPFEPLVNILSKESGVDKINILYRIESIMNDIGVKSEWTNDYEQKLRSYLDEISCKYAYTRPRVNIVQNAIMILATELLDSHLIKDTPLLLNILRRYDYQVSTFKNVLIPSFIQTISEGEYRGVHSDWINNIDNNTRMKEDLISYEKGSIIIGEHTFVRNLEWGSPTEIYMSQISEDEIIDKDDYFIFGSAFQIPSEEYYNMRSISDQIIIMRHHRFNQFNVKSNWLAINPIFARFVEWEPDSSKLFGWKNSKGELMAESIYWYNGNVDMVPYQSSEVGEGWFVIVSQKGFEELKDFVPNIYIQKKIIRTKNEKTGVIEQSINEVKKYENEE